MCKTAYSILIERAAKYADREDRKLEVYFEQAGKKEDRNILIYTKELKVHGSPFRRIHQSAMIRITPKISNG